MTLGSPLARVNLRYWLMFGQVAHPSQSAWPGWASIYMGHIIWNPLKSLPKQG